MPRPIQEIDIRLVLGRLRPGSQYHWTAPQELGNTLDEAVGDWLDPSTTKPTEQQVINEWDVYLLEKTAQDAAETVKNTDLNDLRAAQVQAALDSIEADITALGASPSNAVVLQIVGRILVRQRRIIKALRHLVVTG